MTEFIFRDEYPAAVGYGPGQAVVDRESGAVFGWVRRIEGPSPTARGEWMVYGPDGAEVGALPSRVRAARYLRDEASRRQS